MIMTTYEPTVGDIVQSTYRAAWHGIVLDTITSTGGRRSGRRLVAVLPLFTRDGRPQRKPNVHVMHVSWFHKSSLEITSEDMRRVYAKINQKGYKQNVTAKLQQYCF